MKSILVICFTDLKNDARVTRQINFLKGHYKITVACLDSNQDNAIEIIRLRKHELTLSRKVMLSFLLLARFDSTAYYYLYNFKQYIPELKAKKFDIILANDIEALPFAFDIGTPSTRIFFDAHEYAPRQFEDRLYWRIFFQRFITNLCSTFVPKVDGMSTINAGMAEAFRKNFNISPVIITNASPFYDLFPIERAKLPIRLVHHGIFTLSRQPDLMIEMMNRLDSRFTLDLIYLLPGHASRGTLEYFQRFRIKAEQTGRIRVLPALKPSELVQTLNENYDMGIILVPPVNFNYENGLPNKLFECVQARISMAVGPLREIASVVNRYKIGVVSNNFTATGLAEVINNLTLEDINQFKKSTTLAATEMNSESNRKILLSSLEHMFRDSS